MFGDSSIYLFFYSIFFFKDILTFFFFFMLSLIIFLQFFKPQKKLYVNNYLTFFFFLCAIFSLLFYLYKFYVNIFLLPLSYFYTFFLSNSLVQNIFSDVIVCLCILTTLISWIYLSERYLFKHNFFIFYFFIFFICTIQMVYCDDLFIMFIYFEFLFIPSLFFVYYLGYSKKVDITISFLLKWTLTGSFLVLMCFSYIYNLVGSLFIEDLFYYNFSFLEKNLILFLLFIGFGVKLPIWPFYYWLTKVHVEAPTGFSIFLSGFLVKTAFFCLSYIYYIFNSQSFIYISSIFILWGTLDASIRMWTSTDIKRLIAFATIQEMNLIMFFYLFLEDINYNILNCFLLVHGVLSAFFFFLVDQVQKQTFTRNLVSISGLSIFLPLLTVLIWLALLIFRGFPFFIKFFIEWDILSLLILNFNIFGLIFFFLVSFFGVSGFARIWFIVMYGTPITNYFRSDILKKDFIIGFLFSSILLLLHMFMFLF